MKSNCQAVAVQTLRSSRDTEEEGVQGRPPRCRGPAHTPRRPPVSAPTLLLPAQAFLCIRANIVQILTVKQKNNKQCPRGLNVWTVRIL